MLSQKGVKALRITLYSLTDRSMLNLLLVDLLRARGSPALRWRSHGQVVGHPAQHLCALPRVGVVHPVQVHPQWVQGVVVVPVKISCRIMFVEYTVRCVPEWCSGPDVRPPLHEGEVGVVAALLSGLRKRARPVIMRVRRGE